MNFDALEQFEDEDERREFGENIRWFAQAICALNAELGPMEPEIRVVVIREWIRGFFGRNEDVP